MAGYASIAMFGNTHQPVDVMVQTGHLFAPMPDVIRDDMAFIDRLHFYLPGWEMPKMRNEHFTDHYGFVVDYLAEALRELRKHNFTEIIDHHFSLGAHLNARDRKAVRRTVSGLVKILHPHGEVSQEDLAEILELAIEGRRRVKEQLKKMGSFEYYQTSFSYLDQRDRRGALRRRARAGRPRPHLRRPAAAGHGLHRLGERRRHGRALPRRGHARPSGTGKLKLAGGVAGAMKESVSRAFSYLLANKTAFGVGREVDTSDFHVEVIDLLGNKVEAEIGVAFFVAAYSALRKAPPQPALAGPRRHEHPGQHQARALARRAPPGRHGQRRQARADPDREQAPVPGGQPGRPGAGRSGLLRRSAPGGVQGTWSNLSLGSR